MKTHVWAYLGISNGIGFDYDFFQYKGKQIPNNLATATTGDEWGYKTKGFHLDSGATIVTISSNYTTSGQSVLRGSGFIWLWTDKCYKSILQIEH